MSNCRFDSYIFDMDGTLWDAVDSYCAVWNRTIADMGMKVAPVERGRLQPLMGKHLDVIYDHLIGDGAAREAFNKALSINEARMMPELGGRLYPHVRSTLEELRRQGARLFMVSNCSPSGLTNFLAFTGLGDLIEDTLSYGQTGKDKAENIVTLVERYNLKAPLYVGDIQSDCLSAHAAGIGFVWAAYGFGGCVSAPDFAIQSFADLASIVQLQTPQQ